MKAFLKFYQLLKDISKKKTHQEKKRLGFKKTSLTMTM